MSKHRSGSCYLGADGSAGEIGSQVVPQVHVESHSMGSTREDRPRAADPDLGWDIRGSPWGGGLPSHPQLFCKFPTAHGEWDVSGTRLCGALRSGGGRLRDSTAQA